MLRIADPQLEHIDSSPLTVGANVEIRLAAAGGDSLQLVLAGQIAAVEPEFGRHGAVLAARGYDGSHVLNRTRTTETYQNMSSDDIAAKVADRAGLDAGTIESAGDVHDFVQQNNETDWEFLWRLARRIDFEVLGRPGRAQLPEGRQDSGDGAADAALGRGSVDVQAARHRRPAGRRGGRALVGPGREGRDRVAPGRPARPTPRSGSSAATSARPSAAAR